MLDEEHKLFLKKKEKFENGLQRDQERIQSEQQVQLMNFYFLFV